MNFISFDLISIYVTFHCCVFLAVGAVQSSSPYLLSLISQTIKQSAFPTKFPINSSEYISIHQLCQLICKLQSAWQAESLWRSLAESNEYEFLSYSSRQYPGGILIRIQFRRVQISICQLAHISMKLGLECICEMHWHCNTGNFQRWLCDTVFQRLHSGIHMGCNHRWSQCVLI